jgi:ElaB/YqjD/DUF883 family membrane-anchored ribosome-binding protein
LHKAPPYRGPYQDLRGLLFGGTMWCKSRSIRDIPGWTGSAGTMERDDMAETTPKTAKPRKRATSSTAAAKPATPRSAEAKSRFNAALEEARAGAALLGAEARDRAGAYGSQARARGDDWVGEAKSKAGELAVQGKGKASEALSGLGKVVADNAAVIDDNLGEKYGDYARSASRKLHDTAEALDRKTVDELGEDARELVRKSPAAAVGLAAIAGFLIASLFRRK